MNYGRLALAAMAATVVDIVFGFIVYGNLMVGQFALYPGVYRPADLQPPFLPFLFGGIFLAMLAASCIYAKGYEGGSGAMEGARFGALVGILEVGYSVLVSYAILNIGRRLTLAMGAAALAEWIISGVAIGVVYKPAAGAASRRAAGV
jgi:hypothetical protein